MGGYVDRRKDAFREVGRQFCILIFAIYNLQCLSFRGRETPPTMNRKGGFETRPYVLIIISLCEKGRNALRPYIIMENWWCAGSLESLTPSIT
jgi:hypothetical protein